MTLEAVRGTTGLRMTEDEFDAWSNRDTRAEFVDGKVIQMSPVSLTHARLFRFLMGLLDGYLEQHPHGEVLGSEYQVRLRDGLRRVPDLLFVAAENRSRLNRTRLDGPPDAAWEIVSDESVERDVRDKYLEYEAAGVREYWIIDPAHERVSLYQLDEGKYRLVEGAEGRLHSTIVPGFWIKPEWLWQDPLPRVKECLREMGVD